MVGYCDQNEGISQCVFCVQEAPDRAPRVVLNLNFVALACRLLHVSRPNWRGKVSLVGCPNAAFLSTGRQLPPLEFTTSRNPSGPEDLRM